MFLPQCRLLLSRSILSESWLESTQVCFRRFRSSKTSSCSRGAPQLDVAVLPGAHRHENRKSLRLSHASDAKSKYDSPLATNALPSRRRRRSVARKKPDRFDDVHVTDESDTIPIIMTKVEEWVRLPPVLRRMEAFGIPRGDLPELLASFLADIRNGMLSDPDRLKKLDFDRLLFSPADTSSGQRVDQVISQLFFSWVADPAVQVRLRYSVSRSTLDNLVRLYNAADMSFPADQFPVARAMRRKVIMHVGPTNSGKTHMALRALAAASSGLYAGPLRLLAHEIWERLNKGQIVPLGVDPEEGSEPDTAINSDVVDETGTTPTLRQQGSNKYARECNLRTGEEFRVVSDHAPLLSCTVEMAVLDTPLDVAVVDEIQMIADPARGSAWTMAVLGLAAREVHLCGEEAAVPVVEKILKTTGDELIVNRYERLTPLVVQEESLHGDLSRIQKGDCIVTFSRGQIFSLKKRVEEQTGLMCAVAYGKLPPEIRSEQAALFNDPNSGYDVIVASDAIGMGLNLRIKRVVFEVLHKFDGYRQRPLSVSQIKQIAGRAGRYGLHGEPGGFVTTLYPQDLPELKSTLTMPPEILTHAVIDPTESWMEDVAQLLPSHASIRALFEVPSYVSKVRPPFRAALPSKLDEMVKFIDNRARDLLLADKLMFKNCPVSWREADALDILSQITGLYKEDVRVNLDAVLAVAPLMSTLEGVEKRMGGKVKISTSQVKSALRVLEDMHRTLILYLWLGFRNYMAFHQAEEAYALKERVERALDWCLRKLSGQDLSKGSEPVKDDTGRLEYRQKRKSRDARDEEVRVAVAAAEIVAAARRTVRPDS